MFGTDRSFIRSFGELTEGLRVTRTNSLMVPLFTVVFTVRRLILLLLAVSLKDYHPANQAQTFIFLSILNSAYIIFWQPFESKRQNKLEIFNEFCITAVGYLNLVLTDFVPSIDTR